MTTASGTKPSDSAESRASSSSSMRMDTIDSRRARVAATFEAVASASCRIEGSDSTMREQLERACSRPDLRLLATGATFQVGVDMTDPFRVIAPGTVHISSRAASEGAALVVYVRHALEIAMWHRISPAPRRPEVEVASAALACCTAVRYLDTLTSDEREAALAANPDWFRYLARLFRQNSERERDRDVQLAAGLVGFCRQLLPLQNGTALAECDDAQVEDAAVALTAELLTLASPVEMLLGSGGDSRLKVDPASRLNKYGCSTAPRPVITFSSCTASSTSDIGYGNAELTRQRLIREIVSGHAYTAAASDAIEATRQELAGVLELSSVPGAEIVFAASGTDCEFLALHAALAVDDRPLLSIVIGPDEIGSGSLPAASGRHFDEIAPLTSGVSAGTPVEGVPVDRVTIQTLALRDASGEPIPLGAIDDDVSQRARAAVAEGRRVLLHVVDSSKTGMRAPSFACVSRLKAELGASLTVLLDAAQMRTRTERLIAAVADGAMVMISGSKFFTGAPFSGALIMPADLSALMRDAADVPAGFAAYVSRLEIPASWSRFRAALPPTPNLGLLMRWRTALAEIEAFAAVPLATRNEWYNAFRDRATALLDEADGFQPVAAPVADRVLDPAADWDAHPTIFTFFPIAPDAIGSATPITYEDAWEMYLALNRDVSAQLPPEISPAQRALGATACHVGQPVKIKSADGQVRGALRVAVGARYASRVAFDPTLGKDPSERLASQLDDLGQALEKVQLLVRYWAHIRARSAVA
jgi:selenocysteine lyase/cysteine desulfurase